MNRRIVLRPEAEQEVLSARDWYDEQSPGLGERYITAVESVVRRIQDHPELHPYVHGEIRRAIVKKFPYAVFYRLLDEEIVVLAVMHGRRHPSRWQMRNG